MPPKFKRNLSEEDLLNSHHTEREKLLASDGEEDFFLKGPSSSSRTVTIQDDKLRQVQVHINEVSSVMKDNIGKMIDRGERLEDLEDKSELLCDRADDFRITARKMKARMWWKNTKMKIIIAVVVIVILLIIIVPVIARNT